MRHLKVILGFLSLRICRWERKGFGHDLCELPVSVDTRTSDALYAEVKQDERVHMVQHEEVTLAFGTLHFKMETKIKVCDSVEEVNCPRNRQLAIFKTGFQYF